MELLHDGCDVKSGGGLCEDLGFRVLEQLKFVNFFREVQIKKDWQLSRREVMRLRMLSPVKFTAL